MKVDGKTTGTYDGIIHIMWGEKAKTIPISASGTEDDEFISLDDCLDRIGYDGNGVVYVIIDTALHGTIYQYGNYAEVGWVEYGTTIGYA